MVRTTLLILGIILGSIIWIIVGGTVLSHLGVSGMIEAILGGSQKNIPKI